MTAYEIGYSPFEISTDGNDNILFQVRYRNEVTLYNPTQIMAMLLQELRGTATKNLKTEASDCVISVPSFFTDSQRHALLDASKIAGLNCLKIMSETSAVALSYGLFKQDLPATEEPSRVVAFIDMGHSALQVCICAFNKGKVKVLSVASDPSLGGRNFDYRIRDYFASKFVEKYKIDCKTSPRPWARLLTESEKIKKQMSSNTTDLQIFIECFMDEKDVSCSLNRAQFEEFSQDLFDRVEGPMQTALTDSGLKTEDIKFVEIVGGSTRIPAVKATIQKVFGNTISTTLNADEAVARGCAIQCAMLSHTIRVRDIDVQDACSYPIHISWDSTKNDETGQMEIFSKYHNFPATKMLTLQRKEPFKLRAYYHENTPVPFLNKKIAEFLIKDVTPTADGEPSKVKVKVRLNTHGCFTVHSAIMVEKLPTPPPSPVKDEAAESLSFPMATDGAATPAEADKSEKAMDTDPPADAPAGEDNKENASETNTADDNKTETPKPDSKPEPKVAPTKKQKKNIKNHDLGVEAYQEVLSKSQMDEMLNVEKALVENIKLDKLIADSKNAVEEYIYNMREELDEKYRDYIVEAELDKFQSTLDDTENWLYDEGEDQPKQAYIDKLSELTAIGNPVQERHYLHTELPNSFNAYGSNMLKYRKIVDQYNNGDEVYAHIEKAEMEKVSKRLEEKFKWLNEKMTKFQNTKKHEKPPIAPSAVTAETKILSSFCDPIVNKPKPKAEPPKDDKKTEPAADAATTNDSEKPMDTDGAADTAAGAAPEAAPNSNLDMEVD
jgi:molecular chaperone DnaK (HSP70)